MAQVRSIMTSRNLPLKKLPGSGEWMFLRGTVSFEDAMYQYTELMYDFKYNGGIRPSIDFGKNKIMIGYGYSESPNIEFKWGNHDEVAF